MESEIERIYAWQHEHPQSSYEISHISTEVGIPGRITETRWVNVKPKIVPTK